MKFLAILFVCLLVSASTREFNFVMTFAILAGATLVEATARGIIERFARRQPSAWSESR